MIHERAPQIVKIWNNSQPRKQKAMIQALQTLQTNTGAIFDPAETAAPLTFSNDAAALKAAQTAVAAVDRSHWGRIQVADADRLRFLHNQTTNDFQTLQPGQGCDAVFVTSTGRTIDLVTAYICEDTVLLLTSPKLQQNLIDWMDRYIFFADKVKLTDITPETAAFTVLGPESDTLLEKLGATALIGCPYASHQTFAFANTEIKAAVGSGLTIPGYTLIAPAEQAAALWQKLTDSGAVPLGEKVWSQLRIEQGRPMPGQELTEDYNPLEAGLWRNLSFSKGCYIGQETIARLNTYQGVKQQLWGVKLSAIAPPGATITIGENKVGKLTSVIETAEGYIGLAYIRTKAGGQGLKVQIGDTTGEIIDIPFATRGYLEQKAEE